MKDSSFGRSQLVARARERMARTGAPRVLLSLIMIFAACAAFVASIATLRLGLDSMRLRYPLAVIVGYVTFLVFIRGWIAWHRRGRGSESGSTLGDLVNSIDVGDFSLPSRSGAQPSSFAGGRSGGGGGGGNSWSSLVSSSRSSGGGSSGGSGLALDVDEMWPVVLALACALGGLLAIFYVIYTAPVLLAEVALDAAIVSTLYQRLVKREMSHWAVTVVRHTWLPALALVVLAAVGGWALQIAAPEARSIGGVIRELGG
jgi:hypothetical protein